MVDSNAEGGNVQNKPGASCSTRNEESSLKKTNKKPQKTNTCIDRGISNRSRSQLKELPMAKARAV